MMEQYKSNSKIFNEIFSLIQQEKFTTKKDSTQNTQCFKEQDIKERTTFESCEKSAQEEKDADFNSISHFNVVDVLEKLKIKFEELQQNSQKDDKLEEIILTLENKNELFNIKRDLDEQKINLMNSELALINSSLFDYAENIYPKIEQQFNLLSAKLNELKLYSLKHNVDALTYIFKEQIKDKQPLEKIAKLQLIHIITVNIKHIYQFILSYFDKTQETTVKISKEELNNFKPYSYLEDDFSHLDKQFFSTEKTKCCTLSKLNDFISKGNEKLYQFSFIKKLNYLAFQNNVKKLDYYKENKMLAWAQEIFIFFGIISVVSTLSCLFEHGLNFIVFALLFILSSYIYIPIKYKFGQDVDIELTEERKEELRQAIQENEILNSYLTSKQKKVSDLSFNTKFELLKHFI